MAVGLERGRPGPVGKDLRASAEVTPWTLGRRELLPQNPKGLYY